MGTTLKDMANNFNAKTLKNITELKTISTDLVVLEDKGKDQDGGEFSFYYIEVNGERYRVPNSVLAGLKGILDKKNSLKNFAVTKTGEGLKTRYQVIPLD